MKRFVTLFGIFTLFSFHIFSQVGINTKNPEQIFHIDPLANNNLSVSNKTNDDVVITAQGKLGIGTTVPNNELEVRGNTLFTGDMIVNDTAIVNGTASAQKLGINTSVPSATLHLANTENNTKLRISDGSESSANLLTSDADGYAHWEALSPMTSVSDGTLVNGKYVPKGVQTSITSDSLSLTPGRWLIIAKSGVSGSTLYGYYIYMKLMAEAGFNGSTTNAPVVVGGSGSSAELSGAYAAAPHLVCIINIPVSSNTTASGNQTKFWISLSTSGGNGTTTTSTFGKMQFYALRIDRPS